MGRIQKTLINTSVAFGTQIITLIISFILQSAFVRTLGGEYLGLNGMFANVLTILAFTELGIGNAISFALYKPLHDLDYKKIAAIMNFFKNVYTCVGSCIITLSCVLSFFIGNFIHGDTVQYVEIYFFLYAFNSGISYFASYKRTLLLADQKAYINNLNLFITKIIVTVLQLVALGYKSYIAFLLIQIIGTVVSNVVVTKKVDRLYEQVNDFGKEKISSEDLQNIKKSIVGVMGQKIGSIIVNNTNTLLVTSFIGLFSAGIYSSYMLVINGLNLVITQLTNAIIASVGNLGAENDEKKMHQMFRHHMFFTWTIAFFVTVILFNTITPFVTLWLGKEYTFGLLIVFLLVANFYVNITRLSYLSFIQAQGIFVVSGIKSIIEAIINLVACVSVLAAFHLGIEGLVGATLIVNLMVNVFSESFIVIRYGMGSEYPIKHLVDYGGKFVYTIGVCFVLHICIGKLSLVGVTGFIITAFITTLMAFLFYGGIVYRNNSFLYFLKVITNGPLIKKRERI